MTSGSSARHRGILNTGSLEYWIDHNNTGSITIILAGRNTGSKEYKYWNGAN